MINTLKVQTAIAALVMVGVAELGKVGRNNTLYGVGGVLKRCISCVLTTLILR